MDDTLKRTALEPLFKNLAQRDALSEEEKDALVTAAGPVRTFAARTAMIREGSRPEISTLVTRGWAARYNMTAHGNRQITCLHIAGDFVDLHSLPLRTMDHGVEAVTECEVIELPHRELRRITEQFPHLARLLWLLTLVDGAIHRVWLVAMGRQMAVSHLAHLVCEMFVRSRIVGLVLGNSFEFPMTQDELADCAGLSAVHVNRCMQELRRRELLTWQGTTVEILDWDGLVTLGEFDPSFLHLSREPR